MKTYQRNLIILFSAIGILFWICFPYIIEIIPNHIPGIGCADAFNATYVAAGALFTACSFAMSLLLFFFQRKDMISKTSIELFIDIMDKIKNDPLFVQSKNYILSNQFDEDYFALKQYKRIDNITLDDFKIWKDVVMLKKEKLDSYEYIRYFCDKMDFIGIIIKQQYIDATIFDYFGGVVISSYTKLRPLLLETRKDSKNAGRFIHYTYLNNEALKRKESAQKQLYKMNKKFRRDEQKRAKYNDIQSIV